MNFNARVLVVEDESSVAEFIAFLLTRAGCKVEIALEGQTGMKMANTKKFDLVLLDIDLPDITGLEICRELKQRYIPHRTPVILMSGNPNEERRKQAVELGAADFISKPFQIEEFLARISSIIGCGSCQAVV